MIILGLGSNVGNRLGYLQQAIDQLKEKNILTELCCSKIYESPAMLLDGAPAEWNNDFFNMVVGGESVLTAVEILTEIKQIEQELGRNKLGKWSPREIDIDIIAYNQEIINEPNIQLPHVDFAKRDFVLKPLCDIAANWICPLRNKTAIQMLLELSDNIKLTEINSSIK